MKRAAALKLLAGTLVVLVLASALPVAEMLRDEAPDAADAARRGADGAPATPRLPFTPDGPATPGERDSFSNPGGLQGPARADGSFSPADAGAGLSTGSALLDQVLGSARLMGYDVEIPPLPIDEVAPVDPLRAAILEWVAVTGVPVPPEDLAAELARADALPHDLQRDLALLVLSAAKASLLQAQALALLPPADVAWIHTHPEVAADLANGVDSPETRRLAALAAAVDTGKSIEATLLVLQAVEATRGSLARHEADETLRDLSRADVDPTTRAILALLAASGGRMGDADKVRLAAELVATAAGLPVPAPGPAVSFREALAALLAATGQEADPDALAEALARADLLPADLQAALAAPLLAQARAVEAARPGAAPTAQAQALLGVLVATAEALPTLQKHSLYWREAPDALRVGQWTPSHRAGWAAEHAGMLLSTRGDPADVVRAGAILHGLGLVEAEVPPRGFLDAYVALATEGGHPPGPEARAEVADAAARLDPAVRDAAAVMMSGAAEAARLRKAALAALTPEEERFLLVESRALDGLHARAAPTPGELALLSRAAALSARVDGALLAQAALVGVQATLEARDVLDGRGAYAAAGHATPHPTLWQRLLAILPWGSARAQSSPADGADDRAACAPLGTSSGIVQTDCGNDVLLRVLLFARPATAMPGNVAAGAAGGRPGDCDERACNVGLEENTELLVVTGTRGSSLLPQEATRILCDLPDLETCTPTRVNAYGAPAVHLDLGGSDVYQRPVAMTAVNGTARVSLHLDLSGSDTYADPSPLYDGRSPWTRLVGRDAGHATQASAFFGGVAVLVDALGDDAYAGPARSQGYGRYGVGLLADLAGSDSYRAEGFSQGAAGEAFNLGLGILLDAAGDDRRTARGGQGHGLGGLMLDLQGRDEYLNAAPARGMPVLHLDVLPGGDLATLDERRDEAVWLDGPGDLNLGLGVDVESTLARGGDRDGDGWSDFQEFLAGSDPGDPRQGVPQGHETRSRRIAADADGDAWPDFVERAFSTDTQDPRSYPAGFPRGPTFHDPLDLFGGETSTGGAATGPAGGPGPSDKVIDLRLPLQDAGTIDAPCTGEMALNVTDPLPYVPSIRYEVEDRGGDDLATLGIPGTGGNANHADRFNDPKPPASSPERRGERCVFVSYEPAGPGEANASQAGAGRASERRGVSLRMPAGILAVGDAVRTRYEVDYFFVVDLGGDDAFNNSAGGALPVATRSAHPQEPNAVEAAVNATGAYNAAFLAPSLVVNVDPLAGQGGQPGWKETLDNPDRAAGNDRYAAPALRADFAQGSLLGVLVDTAGKDNYTAGNGSQGSMGGVLLDLDGADGYWARDLSQGASVASGTARAQPGQPLGGANPSRDAFARRAAPGMLLDFGPQADKRQSGGSSQGFARGHTDDTAECLAQERCRGASPHAYGILLDQGGGDAYDAATLRGNAVQGAGTQTGVGILVDLAGDDEYLAAGVVSHGATPSQSYPRQGNPPPGQAPGAGVLADLDGHDRYQVAGILRTDRANASTVSRAPAAFSSADGRAQARVHADLGIHLDASGSDPAAAIGAIGGGGRAPQEEPGRGFLVHLPTARFAIGGPEGTTYAQHEYAFVVDLGGVNRYAFNAGGLVPATLVDARPLDPQAPFNQEHVKASLFPVSLLLDAGTHASEYVGGRAFSQGAGLFSVGVLVDGGGDDRFTVLPDPLPASNASWMSSPPTVDGTVAESEWAGVPALALAFASVNDTRVASPFTLRVANDADHLYLAIEGVTASALGEPRRQDRLVVDLDRGARRLPSGLDEVVAALAVGGCAAWDRWYAGATATADPVAAPTPHVKAGCFAGESGNVAFEIQKPLREAFPRDAGDLNLAYDPESGWTDSPRLGLHLEFLESGTGTLYTWPPGTTVRDGEAGFRLDGNLSDEMSAWGVLSLAAMGNATPVPVATRLPVFSQGAGFAGVGVLAMLGTHRSDAVLNASDRAQGYGGYGGLGVLVDGGGDDRYEAADLAHGAAEAQGMGLLVENEGNDQYLGAPRALGWAPADGAALFLDLYGRDAYAHRPASLAVAGITRADLSVVAPPGNERFWMQGPGAGVDYSLTAAAREGIARAVETNQFGPTRTTLVVTKTDGQGGCTDEPVKAVTENVPQPKPIVDGLVCLRAYVNLDGGDPRDPLAQPLAAGAEPLVTVDSVEFLLDGVRHASGRFVKVGQATPDDRRTVWEATINGSRLQDGVRKIAALAVFRVEQRDRGAVLFYDDLDVNNVDNPAVKSVYVNNPPRVSLGLKPPFQGAAQAAFSPLASAPALPHLVADYGVSRDAAEDRLEISQGWKAPPRLSNLPCDDKDASKLCHLLPLYFVPQPGNEWSTTPRGSPSERQTRLESPGAGPFEQWSQPLLTPLNVSKTSSFRVVLPDHNTTLPRHADYKTRITLSLRQGESRDAAYLVGGKPVILYDGVFTSFRRPEVIDTAPMVFNNLRPVLDPTANALDEAGRTLQQNPLSILVGAVLGPCGPGRSDVGNPNVASYCQQMRGDPGATAASIEARPCREGNVLLALRDVYHGLLCGQGLGAALSRSVNDTGNPTADQAVDALTGASHDAGDELRNDARLLRPAKVGGDNWTEFWFDVDPKGLLPDLGDRVVIPAGARLYLEIRSETELFPSGNGDVTRLYASLVDQYFEGAQAARQAAGEENTRKEIFGVPVDPLGLVGEQLTAGKGTVSNIENTVNTLKVLPFSYFTYQGGGEDQARLEIRVPAEATTTVQVAIERPSGPKVLDLVPPREIQGDVPGSPTRGGKVAEAGRVLWKALEGDARFTQHNATFDGTGPTGVVADGLYRLRVKATDFGGREANASGTFLLDRTPPASFVTTRGFAGAAYVQNNAIPVTWSSHEAGSGLSRVAVYARAGGDPNDPAFGLLGPGKWERLGVFPASVRATTHTLQTGVDTYHFLTVAEDRVGNVERAVREPDPFTAGFRAKLARGEFRSVTVDQSRPSLSLPDVPIEGARVLDHRGADVPFVKAGTPVAFRACAGDGHGGGIQTVRLVLDQVNLTTNAVLSRNFTASLVGACDGGQGLYEYAGWGSLNAEKALFPDGAWAVSFDAYDLANNRVQISLGSVILDSRPPALTPHDAVYPAGQSAVKPGDLVSVRFLAEDPYGVDDAGIVVDAGALNRTGRLAARPVRVDGVLLHEATFRVDAQVENKVYEVRATVPDNAGNAETLLFHLPVDFKRFSIEPGSLRVSDVTHNSLVLRWNTTENTTGQVRYGPGPLELRQRSALSADLVKEHAVKVEGLQASTRYFLRAASTSAGGQSNESDVIEALTSSALFLDPVSPKAGSQLSGVVPLVFKGGLRDNAGFVTYTVEVRPRPTADWAFVTTATRAGGEHSVPLNTSRLLDGGAYHVRVTAEAGKDKASVVMGPYLLDNTPPQVSVLGPLLATNDTTPLVMADVRDDLSGLGAEPATLLVDGRPVDGLVVESLGGGLTRVSHQVVGALKPGTRAFELRVQDRAGALAVETWRVSIDGDAPVVEANPLAFAPGPLAARAGGTVTLNLTVRDESGVSSVTADLAGLSSMPSMRLSRVAGTDFFTGTFQVNAQEAASVRRVGLAALDMAGNARLAGVDVPVDNLPPRVGGVHQDDPTHTTVRLRVPEVDEPVTLVATARAPRGPPVTAATAAPSTDPALVLAGLLPSRTYEYELRAVDRAGNAVDLSGRFTTRADVSPPQVVKGLEAVDLLNGTLRLAWRPALDDVGVAVYRVLRDDVLVAEVEGTSWDDAGLPFETTFAYRVVAIDHGDNAGPASEPLRASATALPRLSAGAAAPPAGTPSTLFRYVVTYVSPAGREPQSVTVVLDGVPQTMTREAGGSPLTGLAYAYETTLAPHQRDKPHTYRFEASDGKNVARFPEDGSTLRGPLVAGDLAAGDEAGGFAAFAQRVPLGGAAATAAGLALAVALAFVVRRKKEGPK